MRILIASSHRNIAGGVEKYLQQLLPFLGERGHQLALLYEYRFNPARERVDAPGFDLPCMGTEECGVESALRFIREWSPDAVYSQGLESAELQAALLSEYPNVLYAHNYVGTCVSGEKCHRWPAPKPCDREFGPMCLVHFYPHRCGGLHPVTTWKLYRRAQERNVQLQHYSAVLVASEHMRREFLRHGVKPERLAVAPLPNPNEGTNARTPERVAFGGNLLFLGRLTKIKGGAELLRAIPLAEKMLQTRFTLTVAGDGPEQNSLERLAVRIGSNTQFTGWIGNSQKADLLARTDLLVVPSLWPEPFGLVGLEAGSHGVPAVAYDVGGISEWLVSGYSGELAPGSPPTVEGLAGAIVRAVSDPGHYAALCRGAREVASRFTLAAHVSKLESIFENTLERLPRLPTVAAQGPEAVHIDA